MSESVDLVDVECSKCDNIIQVPENIVDDITGAWYDDHSDYYDTE